MKYTMTPANKRLLATSGILLGLTAMPLQKSVIAQELGSHVHGLTELNLVIANQNIQIEFISPAINLLGFERASNSPEESKLFNEVLEDLQAAEWLLGDQLRDCQMSTPVFEAPEFGSHEMSEGHEDHEHEHEDHEHEHEDYGHGANDHADFRVQYLFDCQSAPPSNFTVTAFDRFVGIEEISVRWIFGRQQGVSNLTPNSATLTFD
ncbi:MAG: hypothetical protein CMQ09_00150 [Gammaproteobacteria bacterium]|nr:hypothetical protein [Gammaproteobacteria bacterium]